MNREQAQTLLNHYRDFPKTEMFSIRPVNYPLFHHLECFAKGWQIQQYDLWNHKFVDVNDINFDSHAGYIKDYKRNSTWNYVARNPKVTNWTFGFVHEDLYARYAGCCNPLKSRLTTWRFIPLDEIIKLYKENERFSFDDHIAGSNLYLIEIDNETTDIIGKWDENRHWTDLQMTIDWKPFKGEIQWQEGR